MLKARVLPYCHTTNSCRWHFEGVFVIIMGMNGVGLSFLSVFLAVATSVATTSTCQSDFSGVREANQSIDPTKLEFKLLSSRRFMLDNELILSRTGSGLVVCESKENPLHGMPISFRTIKSAVTDAYLRPLQRCRNLSPIGTLCLRWTVRTFPECRSRTGHTAECTSMGPIRRLSAEKMR